MLGSPGTLPVGASAFSPADVPGLTLWMAGNRSPFTLNSGNVSQWNDISGSGNHATQATATLQPAYVVSGVNGLPGVDGDATDDVLRLDNSFNTNEIWAQPQKTIFAVIRTGGTLKDNARVFFSLNDAGASAWGVFTRSAGQFDGRYINNASGITTLASMTAAATNTNYVLALRHDGASVKFYVNGLATVGTASNATTDVLSSTKTFDVGGPGTDITVAELILQNGVALSDAQFHQTLTYLANKYGITLS